jgi:hypothetical protein
MRESISLGTVVQHIKHRASPIVVRLEEPGTTYLTMLLVPLRNVFERSQIFEKPEDIILVTIFFEDGYGGESMVFERGIKDRESTARDPVLRTCYEYMAKLWSALDAEGF